MLGNLGKYRLDARLGGGGMAEVFIASTIGAEGFSRRVAIKRVLPGYSENPQFAQMFVSEAQLSSRLQHPNIVSVTDFDRDPEGRLFLVMELVDGKDLDALLSTGPLPFSVINFILTEMLRGLAYAHDLPAGGDDLRGLVHRDVSPHNVLLSWEGAVKVSDFGIAKARQASEATASVFIKGKPAYMSPEQANGEPLDGRSDLFAVGIMLWEMLVGRRLFTGGDTRSLLAQVLFAQIPRPRQQRPDVPKDLDRVCMKMLERELHARYSSGEEVIADLLACESAPKGGREELIALLGERFAEQMPKRQTRRAMSRAASGGVAPAAAAAPPTVSPNAPTLLGHAGAPDSGPGRAAGPSYASQPPRTLGDHAAVAAAPTVAAGAQVAHGAPRPRADELMSAATRTIARRGPSRKVAMATIGAALAVIGAAVAAKLLRGRATGAPAAISAPATDAAVVAPPADAGVPTATPDAPPATAILDAGAGAAALRADAAATDSSASSRGRGTLSVATDPPMEVFIDGKSRGSAPVKVPIRAGAHKVTLRDPETKRKVDEMSVTVEPGKEAVISRKY